MELLTTRGRRVMMCSVFDASGVKLLRRVEGVPECNVDYCDQCGDCLACCGEDECYGGGVQHGGHSWVIYEGDELEAPDVRHAGGER